MNIGMKSGTQIGSNPPAKLLTPKETAALLAISERKLWSMTNQNEIPHIRIGKSVRYAVSDLETWIETKRIDSRCV